MHQVRSLRLSVEQKCDRTSGYNYNDWQRIYTFSYVVMTLEHSSRAAMIMSCNAAAAVRNADLLNNSIQE